MSKKKCLVCGDPDTHFEEKFCSIECADIYDDIDVELWKEKIEKK